MQPLLTRKLGVATASMLVAALFAGISTPAGADGDPGVANGAGGIALDDPPIVVGAGWFATLDTPPAFFWNTTPDTFNNEGPFTYSSPVATVVSVTDDFCQGDQFRVYDNGVALGDTSAVADPGGVCGTGEVGPDAAFADSGWSSGSFLLGPGDHAITIETIQNPFNSGRGYLRVDNATFDDFNALGLQCSGGNRICKEIVYADGDGDGIIEVGELTQFLVELSVSNPGPTDWTNTVVTDNFGGDLDVINPGLAGVTLTLSGKTQKEKLTWTIGNVSDGSSLSLVLSVFTDENPGGNQEYTSCGLHDVNSGAVLKYRDPQKRSWSTSSITAPVYTENQEGDCDGDGFSDGEELDLGTDPFNSADFPSCGGISMVDVCIDMDGIATRFAGGAADTQAVKTDALTAFPIAGPQTSGLDFFDRDGSGTYTAGDDFHSEDTVTCATAERDGAYDLGKDCLVLDVNGDMPDQLGVDCDIEFMIPNPIGTGITGLCPANITWLDDGDGTWESGEDLILDVNADGFFN